MKYFQKRYHIFQLEGVRLSLRVVGHLIIFQILLIMLNHDRLYLVKTDVFQYFGILVFRYFGIKVFSLFLNEDGWYILIIMDSIN